MNDEFESLMHDLIVAALEDGQCGRALGNHPQTDKAEAALRAFFKRVTLYQGFTATEFRRMEFRCVKCRQTRYGVPILRPSVGYVCGECA